MNNGKIGLLTVSIFLLGVLILNSVYLYRNIVGVKLSSSMENVEVEAVSKSEQNMLIIPSLGIKAPIIYSEIVNEELFQKDLQKGVVHYPQTAKIGQAGNSYIFGHSSDYLWTKGDYKTVFALLPRIKLGEKILATDESANQFTYEVFEKKVISPWEVSYLSQDKSKKILTLQTSYPVGTATKRFIVRAQLTDN